MYNGDRKSKFRSRKLDFGKLLPIFKYDEFDELNEYESPIRSVIQVATGVDKEEEEEHHLRQALNYQANQTKQAYYIPTPETSHSLIDDLSSLYPVNFIQGKFDTKTLQRTTSLLGKDPYQKYPRYNADGEDIAFLGELRHRHGKQIPSKFDLLTYEWIINYLEESAHKLSEAVVSTESIEPLRDEFSGKLPEDKVINEIIEHWREKRHRRWIVPFLRHEDFGKIGADPYVCFRRRELKLPRKTRRNDAQIMDRLKKLYLDLSSIKLLLEASIKRDKYKREALCLEEELFDRYRTIENWRKHTKSEWPPNLPAFKTAAQSLLEVKRKRPATKEQGIAASIDMDHHRHKHSTHISPFKGSKYARNFYPHEIAKQIQADYEMLVKTTDEKGGRGKAVDDICPLGNEPSGQAFTNNKLFDYPISCRRGRGGRIVIDRSRHQNQSCTAIPLPNGHPHCIKFISQSLTAKEFTRLQTPIGNYNVHAVQCANQILRPMSFPAWLAATAPIVQSLSIARTKSPKKKRPRSETESTEANNKLTKETSNDQITVKIKEQPKENSRRGSAGARFTPHGLTPSTDDDDDEDA